MITFDENLLKAVHQSAPDVETKALAELAGISPKNISRSLKRHRDAGLIKADAIVLSPKGARLAGVAPESTATADSEAPPPSDTRAGATSVPLSSIHSSSLNPRKVFDKDEIEGLAESIKNKGLLQNLTIRPVTGKRIHDKPYEIVAGERRWRALDLLAGRGDIGPDHPVDVKIRDISDVEFLELAVIENGQRTNIHPLEEAEAIHALQEAKLAAGSKKDARAVCTEIGKLLGFGKRWAQIRVNMVKRLSEATREAFRTDVFTSVKWADELGRWPHDTQAAAIDAIQDGYITTESELKEWLRGEALPVGKQCFSGEDYTKIGGQISEPDEEDKVYFVNPGIAKKLAEDFRDAKVAALIEEHGYGGEPRTGDWSNTYNWPDVKGLSPKPPKELRTVEAVLDQETLELRVRHPVVSRDEYDLWLKRREGEKKIKAEKAAKADASTEPEKKGKGKEPEREPAKEIGRGQWHAGAKARTKVLREAIQDSPELAMALALVALLPTEGHPTSMTRISRQHASGDAGQIGFGHAGPGCLKLRPKDGFNDNGNITNTNKALASLIEDPEGTAKIFANLIADLTIDCDYSAKPGAMPEAQAIAEAELVENPGGALVDTDWMKRYSRAQQSVFIDAFDLFLDVDAIESLKKAEASEKIADAFPEDKTPIEARIVSPEVAMALEARLLKGEKV